MHIAEIIKNCFIGSIEPFVPILYNLNIYYNTLMEVKQHSNQLQSLKL